MHLEKMPAHAMNGRTGIRASRAILNYGKIRRSLDLIIFLLGTSMAYNLYNILATNPLSDGNDESKRSRKSLINFSVMYYFRISASINLFEMRQIKMQYIP